VISRGTDEHTDVLKGHNLDMTERKRFSVKKKAYIFVSHKAMAPEYLQYIVHMVTFFGEFNGSFHVT